MSENEGRSRTIKTRALIIGAGPAGLASYVCLKRRGIEAEILEREKDVAQSWERHYDRLHLHTPKHHSHLPYLRFPKSYPRYPSRQQFLDYLKLYAETFAIRPRLKEEAKNIVRENNLWKVRTPKGTYLTPHLVVATGFNGKPHVPRFPGMESFSGEMFHSSLYKNGKAWKGKRVLVVGAGNSGAEIALDLAEHGAYTFLCIRGPVHVVPRDLLGRSVVDTSILMNRLPRALADGISTFILNRVIGDLSGFGIKRPKMGPRQHLDLTGRIPLIDVGTVKFIKKGLIRVVAGIKEITSTEVAFVDGPKLPFDAIILATGHRQSLPLFTGGTEETEQPGLHFIGFNNKSTGLLREIGLESLQMSKLVSGISTMPQMFDQ